MNGEIVYDSRLTALLLFTTNKLLLCIYSELQELLNYSRHRVWRSVTSRRRASANLRQRSPSEISVEKFDDSSLINRNLWHILWPVIKPGRQSPSRPVSKVMNDVNCDLSLGTNWTLDMFIAWTLYRLLIAERALRELIPKTSPKALEVFSHYFSIIFVFENI